MRRQNAALDKKPQRKRQQLKQLHIYKKRRSLPTSSSLEIPHFPPNSPPQVHITTPRLLHLGNKPQNKPKPHKVRLIPNMTQTVIAISCVRFPTLLAHYHTPSRYTNAI
ncbi:hypothetical protein M758_3G234600 [Ceratodon purpureus]|nr:hypothetical protein M758_3G234600 [Ceratodon purpureus]